MNEHQIAAEALAQFEKSIETDGPPLDSFERGQFLEAVQSAIEKATEELQTRHDYWRNLFLSRQPAHANEPLSMLLSDIRVFLIRYRNGVVEHAEALKLQGRIDLFMSRTAHANP